MDLNTIRSFRDTGRYVDVIFNVSLSDQGQSVKFPCHKIIIAASSPFFDKLFTNNMKETGQDIINIGGTDPEAFRVLIDVIYGENIPIDLPWDIRMKFLGLVNRYLIRSINVDALLPRKIPENQLIQFVDALYELYPDGQMPSNVPDIIAENMTDETDLNVLSDEFLSLVFQSESYKTTNTYSYQTNLSDIGNREISKYFAIDKLVKQGHSPDLYKYLRFENLPHGIVSKMDKSILETYLNNFRGSKPLFFNESLGAVSRNLNGIRKSYLSELYPLIGRIKSYDPVVDEFIFETYEETIKLKLPKKIPVFVGDFIRINTASYKRYNNNDEMIFNVTDYQKGVY